MDPVKVELCCEACSAAQWATVTTDLEVKGAPRWFVPKAFAESLVRPGVYCPKHSPIPPPSAKRRTQ